MSVNTEKIDNLKSKSKTGLKKLKNSSKGFGAEFKEFINRGNVMDLAVGVVIGSAFTAIVTSVVNDIIMPIVSLIGGGFDFTNLSVTIPNFFNGEAGATINYGNFIQNVVNFLIIALVVFLMIRLLNRFRREAKPQAVEDKAAAKQEDEQIALLREIRDSLASKKK